MRGIFREFITTLQYGSFKRTVTLLGIIVLALAIPVSITLISRQQSLQQSANYSRSTPTPAPTRPLPTIQPSTAPTRPPNASPTNPFPSLTKSQGTPTLFPNASPTKSQPTPTSFFPSPFIPSPTVAAGNYSISGLVFIDNNKNKIFDGNDTPYAKFAMLTETTTGKKTTSNSGGLYVFSGVSGGARQIRLTVPYGFVSTTTNPVITGVNGNTTVNFGIFQTL